MAEGHRIIIAGGGTGGHIFPAIAIALALERIEPDIVLLFVGAKDKMEMEKIPKAGYRIIGLNITGMDRGGWWKNILLPLKLLRSLQQARKIIHSFRPQVVVGVGGYASFPVLYMAQKAGIPTVIQEQNSYAGKANKILGKKAAVICVAYHGMEHFFPKDRIVHTGNPVRSQMRDDTINRTTALQTLGFQEHKKTLFAFGGSLGAQSINEAIAAGLQKLMQHDIQLIWQTGKPYYQRAQTVAEGNEDSIKVFDFIQDMETAYSAADVVISRAGALSIAELSVSGKPVIFVPFPYAAEDHQTQNALALVDKNAALLVPDIDTKTELVDQAIALLENETMQLELSEQIKKTGTIDADNQIANQILKVI